MASFQNLAAEKNSSLLLKEKMHPPTRQKSFNRQLSHLGTAGTQKQDRRHSNLLL